jgi:hypothetical protein
MLGILDIILWPVKAWYTTLLVILIADKIVAITPVPWDDLIVTVAKKITNQIMSFIDNFIAYIVVKPVEALFNKKEGEKGCCGTDSTECCTTDSNCCSNDDCDCNK